MSEVRPQHSLPERLTSRRGAWVSLVIVLLAFVTLFGLFGRADAPSGNDVAPPASESAQVSDLLEQFPDRGEQSVLIVATRDDGAALTETDLAAVADLAPAIDEQTGLESSRPFTSDDGAAAVIQAPITVGDDNAQTADEVKALRGALAQHPVDGITLQVTGGPAFGADITAAFDGADFTLLMVTIGIVALLLILTYRSPILWLIPLAVVAFADQLAGKVTSAVGTALELQFDTGIISVLVFGAGTNYALLLISRYREELATHDDHRAALATAWRATAPAIIASNVTVVLALATLVLAVIPGTRGLGIASAVGLVMALAAVLFALPPLLAVCGRGVFWPFVPRPGQARQQGRVWGGIATRVVRRPVVAIVAGAALLAVMAMGLFGTSIGLSQTEKFRVASESAAGLETLAEHFPPGEAQPMFVVANTAAADEVASAVEQVDGVVRVTPLAASESGELTKLLVTGEPAPGTQQSLELVQELRDTVHAVPDADALVGGPVAEDLDARAGNLRDLLVIAPLVLAVGFIVLAILLRSLVAPLLLLLVNIASAVA
ncbi:MAG TPA: MMPL family transporter, partial [Agromyces sp.]|nr:MMPL family transporter [Agromyces sp.]